jgi:BirA family transcriptional regulator, biotin operon repressor / biotin---[acetyl-CoA-carboxylase] ligase
MVFDLSEQAIDRALTGRFGKPVRYFETVGSTNTVALDWADDGAPEGAIVVADHQTSGRGRRGRTWVSEPGRALLFSLLLRPPLPPERLGLVTVVLGVACAEAVALSAEVPARLKWPNDVTVDGRKLAGILVETRLRGRRVEAAVAGLGMNVSWAADELPSEIASGATSIAAERARLGVTGCPARAELLAAVLQRTEHWYELVANPTATAGLIARAGELSDVLGRRVTVRVAGGRRVEGTAERLLSSGALQVASESGPVALDAGEIEKVRFE